MTSPRVACLNSGSPRSKAGFDELARGCEFVPPEQAEVIVVLGGDGFLLHSLHQHHHLGRPFYGMNRGTLGFLMNVYRLDDLLARIEAATAYHLHPLAMTATTTSGGVVEARAFNEVAVTRDTGQSANLRISVDGVIRIAKYVGDGMLVATSAGSTAYNASAHGPIIPLGMPTLALTPISPCRPRRWRGALLPQNAVVVFENLDPNKRPLMATADFEQVRDAVSVTVRDDIQTNVTLLFDPDHSLEERVMREQFAD